MTGRTAVGRDQGLAPRAFPTYLQGAMRRLILVLATLATAACSRPDTDTEDGRILFQATCASCHGQDGRGDPIQKARLGVPDMTDPSWQARLSDDGIVMVVRSGSRNGRMPAFTAFTDAQLRGISAHIRGLAAGRQ